MYTVYMCIYSLDFFLIKCKIGLKVTLGQTLWRIHDHCLMTGISTFVVVSLLQTLTSAAQWHKISETPRSSAAPLHIA